MSTSQTNIPDSTEIAALTSDGRGTIIRCPLPALEPGCILVQTTRSMISAGTHLGNARNLREKGDTTGKSVPLGYQCAGKVAAVGKNVTRFSVGDRVACFGGGAKHSRWNVLPQNLCAKIPDGVSDDEASGLNVVLTGVHAIRRSSPVFGENLLVVGMGIVGQISAQIGQCAGYQVMGWDTMPLRLEIAQTCGIDGVHQVPSTDAESVSLAFTDGLGFDAAVMAFGGEGTKALEQVVEVMKRTPDTHREGRVVLVGGLVTISRWGATLSNLDLRSSARTGPGYHDKIWERGESEYPAAWIRWNTQTNMQLALRYMAQGKLQIKPLITHHFPLSQIGQAVDMLVDDPQQALGVVLDLDDDA